MRERVRPPHVCGGAALIVERLGRDVKPAQIEAVLRHSVDDLGKPGQDLLYGHGRINASRVVAPQERLDRGV